MATYNKIYTFTSNSEGFTLTNLTYNSTDQALQISAVGRNTTVIGSASISATYGSLGLEAGSIISSIQLNIDARCSGYNVVDIASWSATLDGTTAISDTNYAGTTSWATSSSSSRSVTKTLNDSFSIVINATADNGNNASALSTIQFDNITLSIEYFPPVHATVDVPLIDLSAAGSYEPSISTTVGIFAQPSVAISNASLLTPSITAIRNHNIPIPVATALSQAQSPALYTNVVITSPVIAASAAAAIPDIIMKRDVLIESETTSATANMPVSKSMIKYNLLSLDALYNMWVRGEIIEGNGFSLSSSGVLTVTEIIEGDGFSLDEYGVLTVSTIEEGGN